MCVSKQRSLYNAPIKGGIRSGIKPPSSQKQVVSSQPKWWFRGPHQSWCLGLVSSGSINKKVSQANEFQDPGVCIGCQPASCGSAVREGSVWFVGSVTQSMQCNAMRVKGFIIYLSKEGVIKQFDILGKGIKKGGARARQEGDSVGKGRL